MFGVGKKSATKKPAAKKAAAKKGLRGYVHAILYCLSLIVLQARSAPRRMDIHAHERTHESRAE